MRLPLPFLLTLPVPLIVEECVRLPVRSKMSVPLFVRFPTSAPVVLPAPIRSVPPVFRFTLPVGLIVSVPLLCTKPPLLIVSVPLLFAVKFVLPTIIVSDVKVPLFTVTTLLVPLTALARMSRLLSRATPPLSSVKLEPPGVP